MTISKHEIPFIHFFYDNQDDFYEMIQIITPKRQSFYKSSQGVIQTKATQ